VHLYVLILSLWSNWTILEKKVETWASKRCNRKRREEKGGVKTNEKEGRRRKV